MEFSSISYSQVALGVVATKLVYCSVKNWWSKKTLKQVYIDAATAVQVSANSDMRDETDYVLEEAPRDHMQVSRKHRGLFRNFLVRMGKAKFGCPKRSEANRMVVRKYLYDLCVERKLIARHINEHLDIAMALVFIPSKEELISEAMSQTGRSKILLQAREALGGGTSTIA
jgi:hypothetical protein